MWYLTFQANEWQKKGLGVFQKKKKTFCVNSHKSYCNQSFGSLMSLCNFGEQLKNLNLENLYAKKNKNV